MKRLAWLTAMRCLALIAMPIAAQAQDLQFHGYADARLQLAGSGEPAWNHGGTDKSGFDSGDATLQFGGAAVAARWQATPELAGVATLQLNPRTSPSLGLLDAYVRYRPVSTTPWRWSARVGAFFPRLSLENEGVGWTSEWTLSPSAINSWVGEELRTIGGEFRLEHRSPAGTLDFAIAAFRYNDPAGELLATRGWALGDITSALNSRVRQPDVHAPTARGTAPLRFKPFEEHDGRTGWHADVGWESPAGAKLRLLRYDNRADPESFGIFGDRKVFSWHTRFWAAGAEFPIGDFTLMGQLMNGATAFEPVEELYLDTRFRAGFLLLGWDRGNWRPALRVDMFSLRQSPESADAFLSEHGRALTAALAWRPLPWLRLSAEALHLRSTRNQRLLDDRQPRQHDTQLQLSARFLF